MSKPNVLTFGACAQRLTQNGYTAVSAIAPDGTWDAAATGHFRAWTAFEASEHPVAVRLRSAHRNLTTMVLEPFAIEDAELLERVRALLAEHGLTAGPYRVGSDGRECYLLRSGFEIPTYRPALDGAVVFGTGSLLALDGQWKNGTLLDVTVAELPAAPRELIETVAGALEHLPFQLAEEHRPPPQPTLEAWIGQ